MRLLLTPWFSSPPMVQPVSKLFCLQVATEGGRGGGHPCEEVGLLAGKLELNP